ncbi:hypothetical protein C8R43DRAFT_1045468 [Mycena crocata]|nr:hypothetical protein C8R43DRAFT_1045468 [Mycena crocata]
MLFGSVLAPIFFSVFYFSLWCLFLFDAAPFWDVLGCSIASTRRGEPQVIPRLRWNVVIVEAEYVAGSACKTRRIPAKV